MPRDEERRPARGHQAANRTAASTSTGRVTNATDNATRRPADPTTPCVVCGRRFPRYNRSITVLRHIGRWVHTSCAFDKTLHHRAFPDCPERMGHHFVFDHHDEVRPFCTPAAARRILAGRWS